MTEAINIPGLTFEAWPKTPRLSAGGVTITEKIDGTNACIIVMPVGAANAWLSEPSYYGGIAWVRDDERSDIQYLVGAQSRKKLIFPGKSTDNAGFAGWVQDHADELVDLLGPGRHFGEWWGQGIQRRYDMDHKVFSLFNYHKFSKIAQERHDWRERTRAIQVSMVPLINVGRATQEAFTDAINILKENGSFASAEWGKRFDRPEGIVIRHQSLGGNLKVLIENDDIPKSLVVHTGVQNTVLGHVEGKLIQAGDIVGPVSL